MQPDRDPSWSAGHDVREAIVIDIPEDLDPNTPVSSLFSGDPIEVRVLSHKASTIRIGIEAPNDLNILRSELVE